MRPEWLIGNWQIGVRVLPHLYDMSLSSTGEADLYFANSKEPNRPSCYKNGDHWQYSEDNNSIRIYPTENVESAGETNLIIDSVNSDRTKLEVHLPAFRTVPVVMTKG